MILAVRLDRTARIVCMAISLLGKNKYANVSGEYMWHQNRDVSLHAHVGKTDSVHHRCEFGHVDVLVNEGRKPVVIVYCGLCGNVLGYNQTIILINRARRHAMAVTMGLAEAKTNFSRVTAEVNRTGIPVTVLKNNKPWVVIMPVERGAADVAVDFMDEYAGVFEELAK